MADFKKGSREFNLPTTAGGQLALTHRKIIRAGSGNSNISTNAFTIYDEDAMTTNDPSDIATYVTATVALCAPAIINCFVESGILESSSQASTIPERLNTSNVEYINDTSWNIKFSYAGKNFVISPLTGGTITCKSASLYRHTIRLSYSSHPTYFDIYFDIINNYSKPYTTLSKVKNALKSICINSNVTSVTFPCSGYYSVLKTDSNYYPYGNPNGFVTQISYYNTTEYFSCVAYSLYKNRDGDYSQNSSTRSITSASVDDYVQFLA